MKKQLRLLALALVGVGAASLQHAAEDPTAPAPAPAIAPAEKSPIMTDLEKLVGEIRTKLEAAQGNLQPAQLTTELAQFDAIIAKYSDAKIEERAGVLWAKALLVLQVFEDYEQGAAIVKRFKTEFPGTEFATKSDEILAAIEQDRKAQEFRSALAVGAQFPGIEGKALGGAEVNTAKLNGKVVLIDFWATWCPPCREEIPNVLAAYEKFHAKGFEVVAVSLDRDEAELKKFIEEKKMAWPQIFEGASEIAEKFGVESIPTTYLVGADGKIVARDLRGEDLAKHLDVLLAGK
ncbi:MAG TPA: TlpA disulfide reductase family protein [Opitutaceae bacterium]|nr:TlpA disulfide reductase family protein [Opitutaceae bacterium]